MPYKPFVPFRILSAYTMLEGAIDPKAMAKLAKERGFPAIAIADRNGLYGAVMFANACKAEGVQPIIGTLLGVARDSEGKQVDYLPLYAQDEAGYDNLCHLVSKAHLERPLEYDPHVGMDDLAGYTDGLIAFTGASEGAVTRLLAEGQQSHAEAALDRLQALFPERLYIELARRGNAVEERAEAALVDLAYARDLPLVATNPANFAEPHMHKAHDAMLCIAGSTHVDAEERAKSNPESYVKTYHMMEEAFDDLPEAVENTLVVAQRCAYAPPYRKPILPSLAGDLEGEARALEEDARKGLEARLEPYGEMSDEQRKVYFDRLQFEVDIINQMGFPGYFLIVADFIKWAKDHDIPVGPGRGSGAGSLVAWALTITDLDPIQLGLLFERFLNPERVSMPDFDIDFCETRRGEVIRYVQQKYGHDHVAQIITFGKLKARAVLRDTGRILQMSYGHVDRLCKMVPNHPTDPWTLPRALNGAADFKAEYDNDNEVKRLVDLAMQLEGFPRNSSTHAAGVVIGDRPLAKLVPLYRDPRSDMPVTQYDMKNVESSGLVKFDFLGLKTLSVLKKAVDLLKRREIDIDLAQLPLDDPKVYELMKAGNTVGVFQLESEGMRRTLTAVKPTNFGDIIALVSLYRPGPMDNIPLFGKRKAGEVEIEYPHAKLEGILAETYGIFVYQEQVMQAAQILAGYSLGDADLLRRAMGKKVQAEMDIQRERFVAGCKEVSGIEKAEANALFDLIDKFAGYGFNKSHAAAYALLAYQTAWLKAHYPEEFYAASMCFDMHQSEKLAIFVDDARRGGITVLPPALNYSEAEYTVEQTDDGYAVRYALAGIRNVGERAMEAIVEERETAGRFESLKDLFERLPKGSMNSRQLEALISAGALDEFEPNRAKLMANVDMLLAVADAAERERSSGQAGLFGGEDAAVEDDLRLKDAEDWSLSEARAREKENMGFSFKQHATAAYREIASAQGARSHASLMSGGVPGGGRMGAVMAVQVEGASKGTTKRGKPFIRAEFSDASGQFSAACFEEGLVEKFLEWAKNGTCVKLDVELDSPSPDEPPRITVRGAVPLDAVRGSMAMLLTLEVESVEAMAQLALALGEGGEGGDEAVATLLTGDAAAPVMRLGRTFSIDGELAERLASVPGLAKVQLTARRGKANLRLVA
ncbi:DNA polymerase III subunit alpha [Qipengyuania flava]|uniref:DNA polymerase III subunit alpha n=1 Tax=Qipengyuania flava TaxID=192812 RepID=UPI001C56354D|nr:DNA polymerase III subunit alpha [Qipengyuania flava]MBW3168545.1 DNA polymerase III subunit alpha [Qipengyuania flava]MBY5965783.1 DNA polymerase III subunit alpha [Qipengyuania flava]MBY6012107.1 DNA polymerase III subunit alpha [Qipengyuania flava]MBY6026549.1 DNA polymerase III subunit alpha [Qipengyuania flava]